MTTTPGPFSYDEYRHAQCALEIGAANDEINQLRSALAASIQRAEALEHELEEIAIAVGFGERPEGQSPVHRASGEYIANRFRKLDAFVKVVRECEHDELCDFPHGLDDEDADAADWGLCECFIGEARALLADNEGR